MSNLHNEYNRFKQLESKIPIEAPGWVAEPCTAPILKRVLNRLARLKIYQSLSDVWSHR